MRECMETERLLLRPFSTGDERDCFAFLSDRETCHLDGGYEPFTEMDEAYKCIMEKFQRQKNRWMLVKRSENRVIGTLHWFPDERRSAKTMEIGYIVSPDCRRKGYAVEAVKALIGYLIQEEGMELVTATAAAQNIPSIALLKKLGFIWEGRIHKAFRLPGYGLVDLESFYWEESSSRNGEEKENVL